MGAIGILGCGTVGMFLALSEPQEVQAEVVQSADWIVTGLSSFPIPAIFGCVILGKDQPSLIPVF